MVFNTFHYLMFFPAVCACYFLVHGHRGKTAILLIASYYFYMAWKPVYALLLLGTTTIDFFCALQLRKCKTVAGRKIWLTVSIVSNLSTLFTFKYFDFATETIAAVSASVGHAVDAPHLGWILPVGISFYTFQSIGYMVDVYRGAAKPEQNFAVFATFVAFFPHLVAGPINRSHDLLAQLRYAHRFDAERVASGLKLVGWGLMKKVCIGDQLAPIVDTVFANPAAYDGPVLAFATVCFSFQIYCDFSGYSDIAIGCAWILGVRLMQNFNSPYLAVSIIDFWRRWHISLSTWFRDYVYYPLGGNRVSPARFHFNILIVFVLSGAWHGAKWTFVIWGAIHAVFYLLAHALLPWQNRIKETMHGSPVQHPLAAVEILLTFCIVSFAWIFFRANSLHDALYVVSHLGQGWARAPESMSEMMRQVFKFGPMTAFAIALIWATLIAWMMRVEAVEHPLNLFGHRAFLVRWAAYYAIVLSIVLLGTFGSSSFIYFQF